MKTELSEQDDSVTSICSRCGVLSHFAMRDHSREFGYITVESRQQCAAYACTHKIFRLLRCSGCHKGAVAEIHSHNSKRVLVSFHPGPLARQPLPAGVPAGLVSEFREAELCASVSARRAALAMFGSTLEKVLKVNGYEKGSLGDKINEAAKEHVITATRQQRAHSKVRDIRNDILHEDWREATPEEVTSAHIYTQRVIEDFYDDRKTVEAHLRNLGRLKDTPTPEPAKA